MKHTNYKLLLKKNRIVTEQQREREKIEKILIYISNLL